MVQAGGPSMTTEAPARIPPHNLDAERAVLGCVLQEGAAMVDRVELEPTAFLLEAHRMIFAAMKGLAGRGAAVSIISVADALAELGLLEAAGGSARLAQIDVEGLLAVPSTLPTYVEIVKTAFDRRSAIQACEEAIAKLYVAPNGTERAAPVLDIAQGLADRFSQLAGQADPIVRAVPIAEVLTDVVAYLDSPPEARDMVRTPIPELNSRLGGGTLAGELVYLGGRPGTSKTALALEWAALAASLGHRTLVISREMRNVALGRRFIAQQLRIPASSLRKADLWPHEREKITEALPRLGALPLWFSDSAMTISQVRRLTRLLMPRLLVVDYVQLVESPADARTGKRLEITAISRGLKKLARQCSVLALSSLRRLGPGEGGKGEKKRRPPPSLDDLKESGDLEADADIVLLLWQKEEGSPDRQLSFSKIRDGQGGGQIELDWDPVYLHFNQVSTDGALAREPGAEDVPF